jgi:hypothetical protein
MGPTGGVVTRDRGVEEMGAAVSGWACLVGGEIRGQ